MDSYEELLKSIADLGPNTMSAVYKFDSVDAGKAAAKTVVNQIPSIVDLARGGKVKIGTVKFRDGVILFIGGLISAEQLSSAHSIILHEGGQFQTAAIPPNSGIILSSSGV